MKIFSSRKRTVAIGAVAAITLVGGGTAFAYWTTTGSGSGEAAVGSNMSITIAATTTGTLAPGGPAMNVNFTAVNPADFTQRLSTIHLTSIDAPAGCPTRLTGSDPAFTMADVHPNQDLAPGANVVSATGSLVMNNTADSQDLCRDAILTLNFTTS